jgi:hypothetical protein
VPNRNSRRSDIADDSLGKIERHRQIAVMVPAFAKAF